MVYEIRMRKLSPYAFIIYKNDSEEIGSSTGLFAHGSNLGGTSTQMFL